MKKIILLGLLAFTVSAVSNAQDFRHEVNGGVGIISTDAVMNIFSDVVVEAAPEGVYTDNDSFSIATHLGYKFILGERYSIGLTYTYSYGTADAMLEGEDVGDFNDNFHTFAAEFQYDWLRHEKFSLYATVGAGVTLFHQKYAPTDGDSSSDNVVDFNFQLSPIGIKYGRQYGVFAEAGFGYKGVVSAGVFARF